MRNILRGYKESVAFVGGIVIVGLLLQLFVGAFNFTLLQVPVNIILGGIMLVVLLLFSYKRKSLLYQWFSGVPMAVTLIGTLAILGIIMGLTPQIQSGDVPNTLPSRLGFSRMTSAWPFVLIYFITLLSLGALIIRRLFSFRIKDYAFYLNHIGLWILLFAAGLGAPDIRRYVMYVQEGETEWHQGVAIKLNDFSMEVYPPESAMARPIPKRFVSDINVYSEDGKLAHTLLEVNKPFKFGNWMLYQYGYDNDAGNRSTYSSILLVYDPWVIPVYVGFALLACGSVCMLWIGGNKRKEVSDDVE